MQRNPCQPLQAGRAVSTHVATGYEPRSRRGELVSNVEPCQHMWQQLTSLILSAASTSATVGDTSVKDPGLWSSNN